MKYARIQNGAHIRVAAISDDGNSYTTKIIDGKEFSGDMRAWISETGGGPDPAIDSASENWAPLDDIRLLAPIIPPRNVFCVGKNYRTHAREFEKSGFDTSSKAGEEIPPFPVVFTKAPTSIIGDGDDIVSHASLTTQLDYEAELAVVIGVRGKHISRANAWSHVYGYTIVNDVTARDFQQRHRQWFLGKSMDTFCPMGPWIARASSIKPEEMAIRCHVNGELRQDSSPAHLIFDIPALIETISAGIELLPGDVIATGTPAGVGIGFDPPRFLRPGDRISISISGIGTLSNSVS